MPGSQNSPPHCLVRVAALAAAAVFAVLPAMAAQIGPPIPLLPPSTTRPSLPPAETAPLPPPVIGQPLAPPAPGWDGDTMPQGGAALPATLWRDTPRAVADLLLARLPDTTSPALQELARRLLLSPATAPEGDDAAGSAPLPALRAAALLRLGALAGVQKVVAAVADDHRAALRPIAVDAAAASGRIDRACKIVGEAIRESAQLRWQRDLVACEALHGDIGQASLGLQLLTEQKDRADETLENAVDALAQRPAPQDVVHLDQPRPLLLRLLVVADRHIAPALIEKLPGDAALTLALDDKAPLTTRLTAAERAAGLGALDVDRLRVLYADAAGLAAAPHAPADDAVLARARDFATLGAIGDPAERLARIAAFVDQYPAYAGGFILAAQLTAPAAHDVTPGPALAGAAATTARVLLAAGDVESAQPWVALASPPQRPVLDAVLTLAEARGDAPPGTIDGAAEAMPIKLLALRAALGSPPSAAQWSRLPAAAWLAPGPSAAPAAAALDLAEAVRGRRFGEAILAAILVAAPRGRLSDEPISLYAVIRALVQLGHQHSARRLAVEAALAR